MSSIGKAGKRELIRFMIYLNRFIQNICVKNEIGSLRKRGKKQPFALGKSALFTRTADEQMILMAD